MIQIITIFYNSGMVVPKYNAKINPANNPKNVQIMPKTLFTDAYELSNIIGMHMIAKRNMVLKW